MKNTPRTILLSAAVIAGTFFCSCNNEYEAPSRLRCEHQEGNDVVIDTQKPRLSWINASQQASYQILVATSEDLLSEGNADVWDSGRTAGSESNLVPYSGPVMQSMEEYWWTVRTWDADGKVSAWAEPARWTAGMFSESDWKALWTGASWQDDGAPEADNSAPMFRKEFAVKSGLERATAFVCGLGWFEMTVNGRKVGEDFFVPGLTDYSARPALEYNKRIPLDPKVSAYRTLYLAYELTGMLTKGVNAVSMLLGNGYYHEGMYNEYKIENYGCPKFICQIKLDYSDGTSELVCSDTSWKEAHSPIVSNNLYQGEIYDAGKEIAGWDKAGFNDASYANAVLKKAPDGKLTANMGPVDRVVETLKPVSFEQLEDGSYRVDFGKVVTGWVRFDGMQMFGGDTLRVSFPSEYPAQGKYEYISASDGEVHYSPKFNWYVFREAIVKGAALLDASQIVAEVVNSDVRPCAEFSSSNKLFEDIERIWRQSQTDNMHAGVASDCPHREKLPYTGDGEIAMPMVIANLDAESFYNKWIGDVLGSQNPETGHVPNGAPWEPWCGGGPAWGAAVCVMPWEFYCRYGDRDLLAKSLLPMKEYVRYMESWKVADGTVEVRKTKPSGEDCYWYNLGDWAPAFELPKDELVHTFVYWLCADLTSKAAEALGDGATAASYAKKAAEARDAFHRRYYDPKAGGYGDFGGNVYALYMGVPEDRLDEVRASLRKEIMETHGGHVNVGFIAHRFLYEVLADNGMNDVAWTILNQRDFPSFGWQLENGATTTWELWSGNNCSLNHPMFGGGLIWFYEMLAGVRTDPSEPGFRHIIIRPVPAAEQGCVSYSIDTPYGKLRSQVTVEGSKVLMEGEIPFGSHATVYVPRSLEAAVKRPLDDDSYEVHELGPGHYEFSAKKLKGVIVTGQNNHNWPVSHIALQKILDNSGMFETDLAISPAPGEDFSGFNVDFGKYDFVVLDYNGDSWNEGMKRAFLDYVDGGGGVVVYHAADNAFSGWKEYNEIIALGGWENRNENSGPYVYWKDGGLVRDTTPGPGGSHGYQHEYVLENRSGNPVTEGLPARWKHGRDELYDSMRGPGNIGELLYTAYSPKEMRGSGKTEPLIFTVDYGKARIFHIMLGHAGESLEDNPAMQCTGFQTMILRGAEWCATGKVTQPVPADFPDDEMVSFRPDYRQ